MVNKLTDGKAFPEMAIESVDLYHLLNLVSNKLYDEFEEYLWGKIENLVKCGCEIVALTSITSHIVYDRLIKRMGKYPSASLMGMPKMACSEALKSGYRRALLLGTIFTMKEDFLKKEFENQGIEVIVPDDAEKELVHRIIAGELELGIVKPESQQTLIDVIAEAKTHKNADVVILGCTELPLTLNNGNTPIPCLDVMDVHIHKIVEECLK